jgi:putative heme-binding domain-containing protein
MVKTVLVFAACAILSFAQRIDEQTAIQIEALNRLKGLDLESNAALKSAVLKVVEKTRGTPHFVELVREFNLKGHGQALLEHALKFPNETSGVEAFRLAVAELGHRSVQPLLSTRDGPAVVQLIGNSNDRGLLQMLRALVPDIQQPLPLRKEAVKALVRSQEGARFLLDLAQKGELPADVKLAVASELNLAPWPDIKQAAAEILPLPQSQNAEPLPPVSELARRPGNAKRGAGIFLSETAACASCHQVDSQGMDFGPRLSEIGTKLGKEALYESILDPSAGISFGYEGWSIELTNGDEAFGLLASETADQIAIKTQNGVTTQYMKSDIARRRKLTTSIMPSGLQLTMSTQDLIDLVEYLSTLRKPEPKP